MNPILLSPPHLCGKEFLYVKEALDHNWVAPAGPHLEAFESELSAYTGRSYAAAVSSGTAALHLALRLAGIGKGDYVACQTLTFVASANAIVYQQAIPVFIDSEMDTWNICPDTLEAGARRYGKRLKAVIAVHLYGMPAKMKELAALCRKHGLILIEDAAGALGSAYDRKKAGSFGDFSIVSFNGNKIVTASAGGALLSDSREAISRARFLACQAKDEGRGYRHSETGFNYRMSNICAGIGRAQMEVLESRIKERRKNFTSYYGRLGGLPGVRFQPEQEGAFSNRWLTALTVDPEESGGISRDDILDKLDAGHIEARPVWRPMHQQPVFRNAPYIGGCAAGNLSERGICLPSGSNLTDTERNRVIESVRTLFG